MHPGLTRNMQTCEKWRRKAEKRYKNSGLDVDKQNYIRLRKQTTELAQEKKQNYYSDKLSSSNSKMLYSIVNRLLDKKQDKILPDTNDNKDLANSCMVYFVEKIEKIRAKFKQDNQGFSLVIG